MPDRIALTVEQSRHLLGQEFLPSSIRVNGKSYTPEIPVAEGNKGVVWKVCDEFGRLRALKLCIYADYEDRSYLEELTRAAPLEQYNMFAEFVDAGLVELKLGTLPKQTFVCFVERWIDGLTLDRFLNDESNLVTASFLLAYVKGMCGALSALQKLNLRHDDPA